MGKKTSAAGKRKLPQENGHGASQGNSNGNGKQKKMRKQQKQQKQQNEIEEEGEDVDFASLGFADALSVGLAFQQLGAVESAVEAYARAVELQPRHYSALCRLADACADAGEFGDARTHYTAASALPEAGDDASLWLRLGMAQAATEDTDGALKSYATAKTLAQKQLQTKKTDEAEKDAEAKRTYGMALAAMANVLGVEKGDVDGAVRVFEDAVRTFPGNANLHFNLATMLLAKGDVARAVTSLKTAIEKDGDVVEFYEELVACLDDGKEKTMYVKKMETLRRTQEAPEEETKEEEEEDEDEDDDDDDDEEVEQEEEEEEENEDEDDDGDEEEDE